MLSHQFYTLPQEDLDLSSLVLPFQRYSVQPLDFNSRLTTKQMQVGSTTRPTVLPSLQPLNPADRIEVLSGQPPDGLRHATSHGGGAWVTIGAVTAESNDEQDFHGSLYPCSRDLQPLLQAPDSPQQASHSATLLAAAAAQPPESSSRLLPSFRVLIQQGEGGERGEAGGGREQRREEGPKACWHAKEEHVCSWPDA